MKLNTIDFNFLLEDLHSKEAEVLNMDQNFEGTMTKTLFFYAYLYLAEKMLQEYDAIRDEINTKYPEEHEWDKRDMIQREFGGYCSHVFRNILRKPVFAYTPEEDKYEWPEECCGKEFITQILNYITTDNSTHANYDEIKTLLDKVEQMSL